MPHKRTNTAVWFETQSRWQIKVQKDGVRRTFTSSAPGRTGQREANSKADAWLEDDIVDTKIHIDRLYDEWESYIKETGSAEKHVKILSVGRTWIKPQIGHIRIENLTEGHLQSVLDAANKKGRAKKT